ncbi:hypothetical protein COOONC_25804 [Cooperia oncophora]
MVFYFHAALCGLFTILWALYYRDKQTKHPFVAKQESRKISYGKQRPTGKMELLDRRTFSRFLNII